MAVSGRDIAAYTNYAGSCVYCYFVMKHSAVVSHLLNFYLPDAFIPYTSFVCCVMLAVAPLFPRRVFDGELIGSTLSPHCFPVIFVMFSLAPPCWGLLFFGP